MFTFPPSPSRTKTAHSPGVEVDYEEPKDESDTHPLSPTVAKRESGRRTKWTVIMLPLALIFLTLLTRYIARSRALDVESPDFSAIGWQSWSSRLRTDNRHRRDSGIPVVAAAAAATSSTPPSTTRASSVTADPSAVPQNLPPIPTAAPTLPTPFPQAFDTSLTRNFSSQSCYNFFVNMTSTPAFRSCRPFSLLLQSSEAFISAQSNVTLLNSIIWGTCNTSLNQDQCNGNMEWFMSELKDQCASDLKDNNAVVIETLESLQAFPVMAKAACLPDPTTNTYCYIKAVVNPNPSDLFFYSLPLGTKLPSTSSPSCSACTKSLMGLYAAAMKTTQLDGLNETYTRAAQFAVKTCGEGYAITNVAGVNEAQKFGAIEPFAVLLAVMFGLVAVMGTP